MLAIVFASMFLASIGVITHNAFADQVVATIPLGHNPYDITVNPSTDKIYAVTRDTPSFNGYVSVIDGATNNVLSTIPMGNNPSAINANPVTNMIYVGNYSGWSISIIDGRTDTVVKTIPNIGPVWGIGINPVTNMIYAADYGNGAGLVVINGTTNTIASKIPFASNEIAHHPAVDPVTNVIYVPTTCSFCNGSYITVINGSTNAVLTKIPAGMVPNYSDVNPKTNMIYVSDDSNVYQLDVINGSTNHLSTIPMTTCAAGVGVNPITNLIYVANCQDNYAYIVNGSTNTITGQVTTGHDPLGVAVNQKTDRIYVANAADGTVSVIQGGSSLPQSVTSQLQVNSQDNSGNPLTGFYTTLSSNGKQVATGFTPAKFTLNYSQTYTVTIANFGKYAFDHWTDTSSTSSTRNISITSNSTIIAAYDTVPQPPTNLSAAAVSSSQINLSWNTPSNNGGLPITGYKIERSADGGNTWSTIASNTNNTSTTYPDIGLTQNSTYTYRVSAVNLAGTSSPSNMTSATTFTVPSPPTSLATNATSSSQINLSWIAPSSNGGTPVTGYEIKRSTDGGSTWSTIVANTGNTSTKYSDTGLAANTTYTYQVFAINSVGTSAPSNTASATTPILTVAGTNVGPVTTTLP